MITIRSIRSSPPLVAAAHALSSATAATAKRVIALRMAGILLSCLADVQRSPADSSRAFQKQPARLVTPRPLRPSGRQKALAQGVLCHTRSSTWAGGLHED